MKAKFYLLAFLAGIMALTACDNNEPVQTQTVDLLLIVDNAWTADNAKIAVWTSGTDVQGEFSAFFTPTTTDSIYSTKINQAATKVTFVRFASSAQTPNWDDKSVILGQSAELDILKNKKFKANGIKDGNVLNGMWDLTNYGAVI